MSLQVAQLVGVEGFFVTPSNTPDPGSASTSVTPAWRGAAMHVVLGLGWSPLATPAQVGARCLYVGRFAVA